jgi:glycosyltransferase involved in cell wall biosynthesis
MKTVRVLHVITDLQTGGEATILSWLLPRLEGLGVSSMLVALAPDVHDRSRTTTRVMQEVQAEGIPVEILGARHAVDVRAGIRLAFLLKRFQPDVVHTYLFHAGMVARPLARALTRARVVSSVVSVDTWKTRSTAALEATSLRLAHRILVNARAVGERLVSDSPALARKIQLQYNGVDLAEIDRIGPGTNVAETLRSQPVVLVAGRLHRAKGPDIGLAAFAGVSRSLPAARLVLVGGGPMEAHLHTEVSRLGLEGRVHFWGTVDHEQVIALMKESDLLLVPSRWEGLTAVVLEAFAAGLPVVATRVGGVPEIVEHERTGLLVEAGDAAGLAKECLRALSDPHLQTQVVEQARARVADYSVEPMVRARLELYRSLAE